MNRSDKTVPGLRTRLIAAGWFALAACVPVLILQIVFRQTGFLFFAITSEPLIDRSVFLLIFGLVPVSAAGFLGFTMGARLADAARPPTPVRAVLQSIALALLSYVLFTGFYAGAITIVLAWPEASRPLETLYGSLIWFVVGLVYGGVLIIIVGAVAGLLLREISKSAFVAQAPRILRPRAIVLNILAGLLFLSNYLIFLVILFFAASRMRHGKISF